MFKCARMSRSMLVGLLVVVFVSGAFAVSCAADPTPTPVPTATAKPTPTPAATPTPVPPMTLAVGTGGDPDNMDPASCSGCAGPLEQVHDGLVQESPDASAILPHLAQSWEFNAAKDAITFKLRPNTVFHDGTVLDAAAVKFYMDRQLDETHESRQEGWCACRYRGSFLVNIESVDVVDPSTVRFNMFGPGPEFLNINWMAAQATQAVSPKAIMEKGPKIAIEPVGAGAFRLREWTKGVRMLFEGMGEDYHTGTVALDSVAWIPIQEPQARYAALKSDIVDLILGVPLDLLEDAEADPNLKLVTNTMRSLTHISMSTKFEPFKDPKVRLAVNYAINKQDILNDILMNRMNPAPGFLDPAGYGPFTNKELNGLPYNPDKAKQLLSEAGYGDGFEVTLYYPSSAPPAIGLVKQAEIATLVQANLADVGINVTLEAQEFGSNIGNFYTGKLDFALFSTGSSAADGYHTLRRLQTKDWPPNGFNYSYYSNSDVDSMLAEAYKPYDQAKRVEILNRVQEIVLLEDPPYVYLAFSNFYMAMNNRVKGAEKELLAKDGIFYLRGISVER
jgi:peptide/nickel transport system substrate-binding protein